MRRKFKKNPKDMAEVAKNINETTKTSKALRRLMEYKIKNNLLPSTNERTI